MAPHPEEQLGLPASPSGVPVQPASEHLSHVPEQWLAEPEHRNAADRLDRLAADYELITGLAWGKFEGADYQYFANELAKYGLAVMRGWMRRRLILARCRERGFGGLPEPPLDAFDDPDVLDELANETVAKALHHFREDVLLAGKWDHHRGASLRTYFIGQCLIRFANIYRQCWPRTPGARRRRPVLGSLDLGGGVNIGGGGEGPGRRGLSAWRGVVTPCRQTPEVSCYRRPSPRALA